LISYRYQEALDPPAPFVNVSLVQPVTGAVLPNVPAQVDSAADRTVVPARLVEGMALPPVGERQVAGLGGRIETFPIYAVRISVHDRPAQLLAVLVCAGEPWVLLGRDCINAHKLILNGPGLTLGLDVSPSS
jgi:hypothetical protein